MTDPQSVPTTYGYDTLNRLASLTYNGQTPNYTFGYDALSRRNSLTRPNGIATSYSYDPVSDLLSVLHKLGTTALDGATYTYDNAGNRKTRTDKRTNVTLTYAYDNIYQLKTAKQGTTTKESYTYDLVGNRLSSLGVSPYNYNSSNELTLTPSGSYTYDNNGNRKTDPSGTQYSWDFENRLTQVILPGTGGTVNFKYDPFGRRIQKSFTQGSTTTTTAYIYDDDNLVASLDNSGNVLSKYADSLDLDEPLQEVVSGATSYYEQDGLGSVSSLSNSAGALANTYSYDSFGKLTASTGSLANPFQYAGREFDIETGTYFYRSRSYDQNVGRFTSEDPSGFSDGVDFYRYVRNNPANNIDPYGLTAYKGFPADKEVQMRNAVNEAIARLENTCPSCAGKDGPKLIDIIQNATFVFQVKSSACGQTGPLSFTGLRHRFGIGPLAFGSRCCSLASTIVHEASHGMRHWSDKRPAQIEQDCFGCTVPE
jgi:RHS repeat-associated protein